VDGRAACYIEQVLGVEKFLDGLREELRTGSFRPLQGEADSQARCSEEVPSPRVSALRDRVVQAALKLVDL
jgi:hypothetical protein